MLEPSIKLYMGNSYLGLTSQNDAAPSGSDDAAPSDSEHAAPAGSKNFPVVKQHLVIAIPISLVI
jgi:hypothetical protein